jgi:ChrR Cupin-like domain/DinB superfamily
MTMLEDLHSRVLLAIHGISDTDRRKAEGEGKWSIANVLAHMADAELVTGTRIRAIVAQDEPRLLGYEQDEWVQVRDGDSIADLLEQIWFHRRANLALIARLPADAFARKGVHGDYGTLTLRELLEKHLIHLAQHLGQIERIKSALGLSHTATPFIDGHASARDGGRRSPGPGISITDLWSEGAHRALRVDFAPGAKWPGLDHHIPGPEEVYVLSGDLVDEGRRFTAGTFVHYPAGSSHSPHSESGCSLFVFYPEG